MAGGWLFLTSRNLLHKVFEECCLSGNLSVYPARVQPEFEPRLSFRTLSTALPLGSHFEPNTIYLYNTVGSNWSPQCSEPGRTEQGSLSIILTPTSSQRFARVMYKEHNHIPLPAIGTAIALTCSVYLRGHNRTF